VSRELADAEEGWTIEILGRRLPARPQRRPLFDPDGRRMTG
jgi:hypothetical protein